MTIGPTATWSSRISAASAAPLAVETGMSKASPRVSIPALRASAAVRTTMEAPVSKRNVTRAPFTLAATENSPLNRRFTITSPPCPTTGSDGHQLRGDPAKEVGRFEAVGVDPGQRDQQRRPDGDRTRRAGDVGRPRAAQKIDQHRQKRRRGDEGAVVESDDLGLGRRQDEEGRRRGDDREREKEAHHRVPADLAAPTGRGSEPH